MQRLQPWLMSGIACFGLSATAIGFRLNPATPQSWFWALELIASALLGIGSLLIIAGIVVEITVPAFVWRFGARGKLYRLLKEKIKEARKLENLTEWQPEREWAQAVIGILQTDKGDWQPEIAELFRLDDANLERPSARQWLAREVLARLIRA